jgi:hypothetical protein
MFIPAPLVIHFETKPKIEMISIEVIKKYEITHEKDPHLEKIFKFLFEELEKKDKMFKP